VTNMWGMFGNTAQFNQPLTGWNVSNVTSMEIMFSNADAFNENISTWNVSNVTNMLGMFGNSNSFNQDISSWNVQNVGNMGYMFFNTVSFNQDLSSWCVSQIPSLPLNFDTGASSWTGGSATRPQWGAPRQIIVPTLWDGNTVINTNLLQLTQTPNTLKIQLGDTITDNNSNTSVVGTLYSDGTYTYVGTGPGGGVAFNCKFPLTFSGPC